MIQIESFTFNPYQTNSYICYSGKEAVLVDASAYDVAEQQAVTDFLERNGLVLRHLLLTHGHVDHIFGCAHFQKAFGMQWHAHPDSAPLMRGAATLAAMFGAHLEAPPPHDILPLREGDTVAFGEATWEVLHTPGHSPGSICFYDRQGGYAMVGDVLFQDSIGRYDLPGGDLPLLMASIHQKLLTLPDEKVIYPGHGPATTIGREKISNPFL